MKTDPSSSKTSIALILVLLLVLAHSLFRFVITPPWGLSDEGAHFEVIEYLARHWQWPTLPTADLALRQEISDVSGQTPCLPDEPWTDTCVGINQYEELPLFYLLQAIVQVVIPLPGVIQRFYLARAVSLGLSLLAAWLAFQLALEVWDRRWKPAVLTVLVMGTNFSYIGTMLAVNNDTLAVGSVTLLAWATVRLLKGKWTVGSWLLWLLAVAVCLLTKSSTLVAALLAGVVVILLVSLRWVQPKFLILACLAVGGVGCVALVNWNGQPGWNVQADDNSSSPVGARVLSLSTSSGVIQSLPPQSVQALSGQEVTLQALVFASKTVPVKISLAFSPELQVTQWADTSPGKWSSIQLTTRIPVEAQYIDIILNVDVNEPILWDGITLRDTSQSQQWVFNGAGEVVAPMFIPRIGNIFIAGRSLNERLVMIYDLPRSIYYYPLEGRYWFSTFWGGWGWNHVSLSVVVIAVYSLVTGLSGLGLILWWLSLYWQRTRPSSLMLVSTLWLALLVVALITQSILRMDYPRAMYPFTFYASARYAFPMMAAFSALMVAGLMQWGAFFKKPRWVYRLTAVAAVVAFLVGVHATLFVHIPSFRESPWVMNPIYLPY